jgi:hypothetical protein
MKKDKYSPPTVTELGTVEDFTRGPGGGRLDSIFGIGDGDGGWKPPWHGGGDHDGFS